MTAPFFATAFRSCQRGQADLRTEVTAFLPQWGWSQSTESFLDFWFSCDSILQTGVLVTLTALRQKGFTCCLATNQERHRTNFLRQHLAIESYFDAAFYSAELGVLKPAGAFFAEIESRVKIDQPDKIIFWDDSEENILAARKRGWAAHLFTDVPNFQHQMRLLA